jgi:hypothetical protein
VEAIQKKTYISKGKNAEQANQAEWANSITKAWKSQIMLFAQAQNASDLSLCNLWL